MCGTGTIILRTQDASDPILTLKNIKDSIRVKEMISDMVERTREDRGIAGREMYGAGGGMMDDIYDDEI